MKCALLFKFLPATGSLTKAAGMSFIVYFNGCFIMLYRVFSRPSFIYGLLSPSNLLSICANWPVSTLQIKAAALISEDVFPPNVDDVFFQCFSR